VVHNDDPSPELRCAPKPFEAIAQRRMLLREPPALASQHEARGASDPDRPIAVVQLHHHLVGHVDIIAVAETVLQRLQPTGKPIHRRRVEKRVQEISGVLQVPDRDPQAMPPRGVGLTEPLAALLDLPILSISRPGATSAIGARSRVDCSLSG
jgi:hypothetical protein